MGFIKKIGIYIGIIAVVGFVINMVSGGGDDVKVVNLDVVLDSFIEVAEAMPETPEAPQGSLAAPTPESDELTNTFMTNYAAKLQEADILEGDTVGIGYADSLGAFVGYSDTNKDGTKNEDEESIFTVEVDSANSRLIATDLQHSYHRDGAYRSSGGGFLTGYLVSRMLFNQRGAGIGSSRFSSMNMSKRGYHSSAKSSVKSSRSARSSGSGSFRSGK